MRELRRISEDATATKDCRSGLVRLVEDQVDIDALLAIAATAAVPPPPAHLAVQPTPSQPRVRLGVAKDVAFGHCYAE